MSFLDENVKVCKRVNNSKRKYLVLNKCQCKHYPSSPISASALFKSLAGSIPDYKDTVLVVGFAETATAIGMGVASYFNWDYVSTTRESFDADFIEFTESHSHATEQKLIKFDFSKYTRIVFVEDEITTGNTILGIIDKLLEYNSNFKFTVASILNGMHDSHKEEYEKRDIDIIYLYSLDNSNFNDIAENIKTTNNIWSYDYSSVDISMPNTRKITDISKYKESLNNLCIKLEDTVDNANNILVLGTEECMYPAIYFGSFLENRLNKKVSCHATTRSPIAVSNEKGYPLNSCYSLPSVYDCSRQTYIYNLSRYDKVYIITDGVDSKGIQALIYALVSVGNRDIILVNLKED